MVLSGPLRTEDKQNRFRQLDRQFRFLGLTSYVTFPAGISEGGIHEYAALCEAWCHCFRDPGRYLPDNLPRLLFSHSDLCDYRALDPERMTPGNDGSRPWDFVYVCLPGPWQERCKNWQLARACLPRLCGELGLRGLLVGRESIPDLPAGLDIDVRGRLPFAELMQCVLRARFLFVPNIEDASPRIITEAMCLNTPILVNRDIVGGWKYVNPFTGAFFSDESDVLEGAVACLEGKLRPRRWFRANHGPWVAGRRLADFLGKLDPDFPATRLTRIESRVVMPDV